MGQQTPPLVLYLLSHPERHSINQLFVNIKGSNNTASVSNVGHVNQNQPRNSASAGNVEAKFQHTQDSSGQQNGFSRDPSMTPRNFETMQRDSVNAWNTSVYSAGRKAAPLTGMMPTCDANLIGLQFQDFAAQVYSVAEFGNYSPSLFSVQFTPRGRAHCAHPHSHNNATANTASKGTADLFAPTLPVCPTLLVIRVAFHRIRNMIPLFALLKALGAASDEAIVKLIVPDNDPEILHLLTPTVADASAYGIMTQSDGLGLIHQMIQQKGIISKTKCSPNLEMTSAKIKSNSMSNLGSADRSYVFKLLQLHLLPHIGVTPQGNVCVCTRIPSHITICQNTVYLPRNTRTYARCPTASPTGPARQLQNEKSADCRRPNAQHSRKGLSPNESATRRTYGCNDTVADRQPKIYRAWHARRHATNFKKTEQPVYKPLFICSYHRHGEDQQPWSLIFAPCSKLQLWNQHYRGHR